MAMLVTVPLFSAPAQTAEATRVERVEKFLEKTSSGRGECGVTSYSVAVACSTILADGSPESDPGRDGSVPTRYVYRKRPALYRALSICRR